MGEFQTFGLSIHLFRPTIALTLATAGIPFNHCATTPRGKLLGDLSETVSDYSHTHSAFGGYDTASFTVTAAQAEIEKWFEQGLGAHVEVVDSAGDIVWEGFVDQLEVQLGPASITRGPVLEIGNQLYVVYTPINTSTSPNTNGAPRVLWPALEDADSQRLYGIRAQTINITSATVADATRMGTMWIQENAWPRTTEQVSLGSGRGSAPTVRFSCKGYFHALTASYYSTEAGTVSASVKLAAILTWDSLYFNGLFAPTNAVITANATAVPAYEANYTDMITQIQEIVSAGGPAPDYARYLFQVGPERAVSYAAMPEDYRYAQALSWDRQTIVTRQGEIVPPWALRSGEWLRFLDWLPAMEDSATMRADPRFMFIESVSYTAPYDVSFNGGKTDSISQVLAQMGLAGEK